METYQAKVLIDHRYALSEGPVWDEREQALHFVDIKGDRVHRFFMTTGELTCVDVCQNVGCFALREAGGYILGLASGIYLLDADGRQLSRLEKPATDPMTRFNDGKCDNKGRFWCGTADLYGFGEYNGGKLYLVTPDLTCVTLMEGLSCSNGLGFAQDGKTVYYIDSTHRQVECYTLDEAHMTLNDRRVIVSIDPSIGVPDGMTMDAQGMLWVAHWGGGFVGRYDPKDGALLCRVEIEASQCSSCCFGGKDYQTLFITSGYGAAQEKHGGCVFNVRLPYKGLPSPRFPT